VLRMATADTHARPPFMRVGKNKPPSATVTLAPSRRVGMAARHGKSSTLGLRPRIPFSNAFLHVSVARFPARWITCVSKRPPSWDLPPMSGPVFGGDVDLNSLMSSWPTVIAAKYYPASARQSLMNSAANDLILGLVMGR